MLWLVQLAGGARLGEALEVRRGQVLLVDQPKVKGSKEEVDKMLGNRKSLPQA